jgi:hypothetical protein
MTCTDCIDRDTARAPSAALSLALILLVIGTIAVLASDPKVPTAGTPEAAEDWHGNVRASGWPND